MAGSKKLPLFPLIIAVVLLGFPAGHQILAHVGLFIAMVVVLLGCPAGLQIYARHGLIIAPLAVQYTDIGLFGTADMTASAQALL